MSSVVCEEIPTWEEKVTKEEKIMEGRTKEEANTKEGEKQARGKDMNITAENDEAKMEVEPRTKVSFPVKLEDGKQLKSVGLRRKRVIAININIYAFGMYADDAQMKEIIKAKFEEVPEQPTKDMFNAVIDADAALMVRLVIVFGSLSMSMVRKSFDEGIGASLKRLNGGQTDKDLVSKVMGSATDNIKLPPGSEIEIARLPGYALQTKVKGAVISTVESELLCRAYFHLYLGDDPFDKDAKETFGTSLLSLF